MDSINKLREWVNGLRGAWIDMKDHSLIFTTGDDVPPSMTSVNLREHLNGILDDIEREMTDMVPLPLDADGVPWRVGDMTDNGNVVNGMTLDFHGWHFTGTRNDIDPTIHRHYVPKPTVEDVLREFAQEMNENLGMYTGEAVDADEWHETDERTIAEFAKRLRLAGEDE